MGAHYEFANTEKQQEIMKHIVETAARGGVIDLHELKAALSYGASISRNALVCSINFLVKHGYVEKHHRHKKPMLLRPTMLGYTTFKPKPEVL